MKNKLAYLTALITILTLPGTAHAEYKQIGTDQGNNLEGQQDSMMQYKINENEIESDSEDVDKAVIDPKKNEFLMMQYKINENEMESDVVDSNKAAVNPKKTQILKNNPELGDDIKTMIEDQEKSQKTTMESLEKMNKRNKALKLMIGSDHRNAAKVRNEINDLRRNITKLEKLKETASEADAEILQTSIDGFKTEADNLEAKLKEETSGFSFFGWLPRMFSN